MVQQILKSRESQQQAQAKEIEIEAQLQAARDAGYSEVELSEMKAELQRERDLASFEEERFKKDCIHQWLL